MLTDQTTLVSYRLIESLYRQPQIVEDIDQIRTSRMDAKQLLSAARSSLERGDLDRADRLVAESEKANSFWSVHLWGDSPSKVRRDIQSARVRLAQEKAKLNALAQEKVKQNALAQSRPAENPATMPASNSNSEAARQLIRQGRAALQVKDYAKARQLAMQAKDMKPDLKWWDDTPEKLLVDVQRMDPSAPATSTASVSFDAKTEVKISDPKQLVRQGREYYTAGKLDEAKDMALRANAAGQVHWGLFEDSPDKLLADVQKAKLKRDQEESVRLLSEARRTLDKANGDPKLLDEAQSKAYKAERLHGPYSIMDFGDRPH